MIFKSLAFIVISFSTSNAFAATTLELIGEGAATHPAQFIKMSISIKTQCFDSSVEARQKFEQVATHLKSTIGHLATNTADGIVVNRGTNDQQEIVEYIDGVRTQLCDNSHSWTSSGSVVVKIDNVQQLPQAQDEILKQIDSLTSNVMLVNTPRVIASLSQPSAGVWADTYQKLQDDALTNALKNARHQAQVLMRETPAATIDLVRVSPSTTGSGVVLYDRTHSSDDPNGISLGVVRVEISRKFLFKVR